MINIAKLLKNCSQGTKLYSPLFGEVEFAEVMDTDYVPIRVICGTIGERFDEFGRYKGNEYPNAECLLFPSKDCRTWEGWKAPRKPNFKVNDWIIYDRTFTIPIQIIKVNQKDGVYVCKSIEGNCGNYSITETDKNYHLWTIKDAENGDVLVNDVGCIFINAGFENDDKVTLTCYCYVSVQGVFYEEKHKIGSWLYVSHVHPATKEQRDLLFTKMKETEYEWNADKKELRKIQQHYDIANFHAGMPVLVRETSLNAWQYVLFSHYYIGGDGLTRFNAGLVGFTQCIPYNDDTKHLLGTTDMCDEQYINW